MYFPDIAKIKFDISGLENSSRQLAMMSLCAWGRVKMMTVSYVNYWNHNI